MTEPTLVKVTRYDPGPNTGDTETPFVGRAAFKPSLVRHIQGETPPDYVVTDRKFYVSFGAALMDGDTIVEPATPGVAWVYLEPTDDGPYANLWFWEYEFLRPGQVDTCAEDGGVFVPTSVGVVDFGDLSEVDPDNPPILPPEWQQDIIALQGDVAALQAEDVNLQNQIDAFVASGVQTVNGEHGAVTVTLDEDPEDSFFYTLTTGGTP